MKKYGSNSVRSLYYSLPSAGKNVLASAYGLNERRLRYRKTFRQTLSFLRESQYWSNKQLLEYQQERLLRFLQDVIHKTPYYRADKVYADLLAANAPLDAFPILDKRTVRKETKRFHHNDLPTMRCRWVSTSGTTGSPLVSPVTVEQFQRECAFRALAYEWAGISLTRRDRVAFCAGHPVAHASTDGPFWAYDWANKWLYFSSYHLAKQNLRHYIAELEKFRPVMLGGYPSSLYLLALAYEKFGGTLKLKAIFSSSETLFDWQREKIERAFGAKVFNYYGTGEMSANVAECEAGELHLKLEHSAVEILNDRNEPCAPGETGRFVSTGLNNYAFPLVRYDVGDEVTISRNQVAQCGRGGLLLEKVVGFVDDYILTPEGRFVGRLDHLIKDRINIVEAQFYQESPAELTCRIVKSEGYTDADERAILKEARNRLGNTIKIQFDYVDRVPRTKNGKFRAMVSKIDQPGMIDDLIR